VGVEFPKLLDEPFDGMNVLGADDLGGPDGQIARKQLRRTRPLRTLEEEGLQEIASWPPWQQCGQSRQEAQAKI